MGHVTHLRGMANTLRMLLLVTGYCCVLHLMLKEPNLIMSVFLVCQSAGSYVPRQDIQLALSLWYPLTAPSQQFLK